MKADDFVEGEWYVDRGRDPRTKAHFYQRTGGGVDWASASCGLGAPVSSLDRAPDNRSQCGLCWRSERMKARRT